MHFLAPFWQCPGAVRVLNSFNSSLPSETGLNPVIWRFTWAALSKCDLPERAAISALPDRSGSLVLTARSRESGAAEKGVAGGSR
jgi:hypothetical protein